MKTKGIIMTSLVMFISLAMVFTATHVLGKDNNNDKVIKVKIVKTENGNSEVIEKTFTDEKALQEFLKANDLDLKVDDIEENEEVEVIIKKKKTSGDEEDVIIEIEEILEDPYMNQTPKPYLGVYFDGITEDAAKEKGLKNHKGVIIEEVIEGTPAKKAGLEEGDFIKSINGEAVTNKQEFVKVLHQSKAGETVAINYIREGKKATTKATLDEGKGCAPPPHCTKPGVYDRKSEGPRQVEEVRERREEIKNKPFLGVVPNFTEDGVAIERVIEESTATELGLKEGDVITRINGEEAKDMEQLRDAINKSKVGENIEVEYVREGANKTASGITKNRGEARVMKFKMDGDKMGHHFERFAEELKEIDVEQYRDVLAHAIEKLEFKLEGLAEKLQDLDIEAEEEITKEMRVIIIMEEVTKEDAAKTGLPTQSNLKVGDLSFSPNPSDGRFELSFNLPEKGKTNLQILDLNGKEIYKEELGKFSGTYKRRIDISDNTEGVYFLNIVQNDKAMNQKIVIQ